MTLENKIEKKKYNLFYTKEIEKKYNIFCIQKKRYKIKIEKKYIIYLA
jgi:hypothetical protein